MASITLTPSSVKAGAKLTVKGTGWGWRYYVYLSLDDPTKLAANLGVAKNTTSKGAFSLEVTIPPGTTPGVHTIYASSRRPASAKAPLVLEATVPVPPPDQPPKISNITAVPTQNSIGVAWDTDEPTQGWVESGATTAYGQETQHETSLNYSHHAQTISGLQPGTTYHFRVHAIDSAGQHVMSPDQVMLTLPAVPGPVPPPISTRPWPAPVTSQTVKLPTSIANDGSVDVGLAIEAWVKTVPNGSRIEFPAGTFKFERLRWEDRLNLEIRGQGPNTKLVLAGQGLNGSSPEGPFILRNSQHILTADFDVTGTDTDKTNIFVPGHEQQFILALSGWYAKPPSSYIEMSGITGRNLYADVVYAEGENVGARRPSDHVWVHHCGTQADPISYVGRMGLLAAINVVDVLMEDCWIDKIGIDAFDVEPNFAVEQVRRVTFRRNHIGTYGHASGWLGWFVNAWTPSTSPVSDIVVDDNDVVGNPAAGNGGGRRALHVNFSNAQLSNIKVTNNRTPQAASGPVMIFENVDGVVETGNVQPGTTPATIATFPGSTNVVHD